MTQWEQFSIFWQEGGHVEIYIVTINITIPLRYLTSFSADDHMNYE